MSLQNKELISASVSGDVMTVVSLLNSGADVQTENEVSILFSHQSSLMYTMWPFHFNIFHVNQYHIVERSSY